MGARLILNEDTKVAFGMSQLDARAKDWAYTLYLADARCFPTWEIFCDKLKDAFMPPHSDFQLRSKFLACSQGRRDLYTYVQELRQLAASITQNPLTEDVKVTVFTQGLRQGPPRLEVFRRMPKSFEEAVQIAMGEQLSHTRAQAPAVPAAPEPMDLSAIQAGSDIVCFRCQRRGHFARDCRASPRTQNRGGNHPNGNPRSPGRQGGQPPAQRTPTSPSGNRGARRQ